MIITPRLFEAYLKCSTKCWLRSINENPTGNAYAEWAETQNKSYRADGRNRLLSGALLGGCTVAPDIRSLKGPKWMLAVDVPGQLPESPCADVCSRGKEVPISEAEVPSSGSEIDQRLITSVHSTTLEFRLDAVQRIPGTGPGKPAQFIPIRFVFTNRVDKDCKLLLAFDALVMSETLKRKICLGKIIHGGSHSILKVKIAALVSEVRKHIEKISALLSNPSPPDLVLNRHCDECEFQLGCRQKAMDKDDLSLLCGVSGKERKKLNSEGIFTVRQFSYTFRPRRRPRKMRDKREKYHHSLKALAIRENKIYIVGSPKLKVDGTPVYVDVEGLPDRDFYYLIGVRIGNGKSAVQHSLWADSVEDERRIWNEFLDIVASTVNPRLLHYGSYETKFFEQMENRYGSTAGATTERIRNREIVNILQEVFGQVYFPTYSNSLKDIATWLGFGWTQTSVIGANSVACRCEWERTRDPSMKNKLVIYNAVDCQALEVVTEALLRLRATDPWGSSGENQPTEAFMFNRSSLQAENGERSKPQSKNSNGSTKRRSGTISGTGSTSNQVIWQNARLVVLPEIDQVPRNATPSIKRLNVPLLHPAHSVAVNPYLAVGSDVLFTTFL